jgi:hypothetical protein
MSYKLMLDMFQYLSSTQKNFNILITIFYPFDIIFTLKYYIYFFQNKPYFIPKTGTPVWNLIAQYPLLWEKGKSRVRYRCHHRQERTNWMITEWQVLYIHPNLFILSMNGTDPMSLQILHITHQIIRSCLYYWQSNALPDEKWVETLTICYITKRLPLTDSIDSNYNINMPARSNTKQ